MTRLVFTGLRNGRTVRVVWHDGALSGDPEACAWIAYIARIAETSGPIASAAGVHRVAHGAPMERRTRESATSAVCASAGSVTQSWTVATCRSSAARKDRGP
jgi:hypothetical protein